MVRRYWQAVHRQAFAEAAAALGLESRVRIAIGTIVLVVALLCLFFWGSADATRDEAIVRLTIAATLVGFFPFVYAWKLVSIPARIDAGLRQEAQRSPLELTLSVRVHNGLYGPEHEFYSIGVRNNGTLSLNDIVVRALDSWFTREIVAVGLTGNSQTYRQPVPILELQTLHPEVSETREVFGIGYGTQISHPDYILNQVQRFTVQAAARNVPTVRKEIEFDPNARPMLRLLP